MKQIALDLGVSIKTVSRVINNERYVNEKVRALVLRRIKDLGYKPNQLARGLVKKKTNTIGLLVSNINSPCFSDEVKSIGKRLQSFGYSLIITDAETFESAKKGIGLLLEKRVDGIIEHTMGFQDTPELDGITQLARYEEYLKEVSEEVRKNEIYFSVIDWDIDPRINSIVGDNYTGSMQMAAHLLQRGHRRIAYISNVGLINHPDGKPDVWSARYAGFTAAMQKQGLALDPALVQYEPESFEGGYRAMRRFIDMKQPPTAVLAANDIYALGAMFAVHEQGLRVPDDFSVAGYDGIEMGTMVWPKLTTMTYDRFKIGAIAVDSLISAINDKEFVSHITILPSLRQGGSVKTIC
jgi:LacI family transcriptional regulator